MYCKALYKYKVVVLLIVTNQKMFFISFFLIQNALEADFKDLKCVDMFNSSQEHHLLVSLLPPRGKESKIGCELSGPAFQVDST